MITNPAVGKSYWIIIDLWETELPAPVVLISDDGGTFTARWHLGEGCTWENESVCIFLDDNAFEDYSGLLPVDLFPSEAEAWAAIRSKGGVRVG